MSKQLRIESGHPVHGDVAPVLSDMVRFITEDGRAMFEVAVGMDGRSIEVRSVETTKVDGVIYDTTLEITPRATNLVIVRTERYDR